MLSLSTTVPIYYSEQGTVSLLARAVENALHHTYCHTGHFWDAVSIVQLARLLIRLPAV